MDCDSVQRELLMYTWDQAGRRVIAAALAHCETCPSCREAFEAYDRMQQAVRPQEIATAEPPGSWAVFENNLEHTRGPRPIRTSNHGLRFSLAASLLLAAIGWGFYWHNLGNIALPGPAVTGGGSVDVRFTGFSPQEVTERVKAFRELSEVFEDRASWVLLSDQSSDMGLRDTPAGQNGELLLMRLLVAQGGKVLSSADLIILPGGNADVEIPSKTGLALHYQIAAGADSPEHVQVWVELKAPGTAGEAVSILATDVGVRSGGWTPVGQMVTSAGQYDVMIEMHPADLRT